jgi:hypothetical protein
MFYHVIQLYEGSHISSVSRYTRVKRAKFKTGTSLTDEQGVNETKPGHNP